MRGYYSRRGDPGDTSGIEPVMSVGTWDSTRGAAELTRNPVPALVDDPEELAGDLARAKAAAVAAGFDFVDLDRFDLEPDAAQLIPRDRAERERAVALGWRYGRPVVAVADPGDLFTLDDIYLTAGRDVHIVVASGLQIDAWTKRSYDELRARSKGQSIHVDLDEALDEAPHSFGEPRDQPVVPSHEAAFDEAAAPSDLPPEEIGSQDEEFLVDSLVDHESEADVETSADLPAPADPPAASGWLQSSFYQGPTWDQTATVERSRDDAVPSGEMGGREGEISDEPAPAATLAEVPFVGATEPGLLPVSEPVFEPASEPVFEPEVYDDAFLLPTEEVERVDLNNWQIDSAASEMLPEALARRHRILAIGYRDGRPVVAMANPSDVFALDDVRSILGSEIVTVSCSVDQIDDYIVRIYRSSGEADAAARRAAQSAVAESESSPFGELANVRSIVEDAPIVKFVNVIMRQALNERASDVHIEPTATDIEVRFRIDGVLHHITSAPKSIHGGVVSRLKIMADLDIAEHRIPQDGRLSLTASSREIDLRVATLPTVHGESIVLRVLDKSTAPLDLSKLGFLPDVLERFERSYRRADGTVIVTGPTGSGKSTTLYATLNQLNSAERKLISVEDPVEYQLRGINQVQVNPRAGLSFANALRAILRADPDVVLVGEIRDRDTATIAIEAALTGHLVLSCLHTNNAASTPLRLVEMGVEPYLVCSALDCVLAQRLARQLCENCAEPYSPTASELTALGFSEEDVPVTGELAFRRAVGCQACSRTGYRGRLAIQEVMTVTDAIERSVLGRGTTDDVFQIAVAEGMRPMRIDGIRKAAMGLTSLEEILRVIV